MRGSPTYFDEYAILGLLWNEGPLKSNEFSEILSGKPKRKATAKSLLKRGFICDRKNITSLTKEGAKKFEKMGVEISGERFYDALGKTTQGVGVLHVYAATGKGLEDMLNECGLNRDSAAIVVKRSKWKPNKHRTIKGFRASVRVL